VSIETFSVTCWGLLITDHIKVNTILDAPVIVKYDCYVKLQVTNIEMKKEAEMGKGRERERERQGERERGRESERCSAPPSFVCFCMQSVSQNSLSDITVLYRNVI
jgi:hypothetical protein